MNPYWYLHKPHNVLIWEQYPLLMMMSSECALVILFDDIIAVQKGLDWFKTSSENQYPTITLPLWEVSRVLLCYYILLRFDPTSPQLVSCSLLKSYCLVFGLSDTQHVCNDARDGIRHAYVWLPSDTTPNIIWKLIQKRVKDIPPQHQLSRKAYTLP